MLEHFRVHGLVYHSVDFAISSQRQPADSVFSFLVPEFRKQFREPLGSLGTEQFNPSGIEEKEELVHTYSEDAGEEKMSEFMYSYKH